MQTIEWNKVTWYSKTAAIVLFVAVFWIGFVIGKDYGMSVKQLADAEVEREESSVQATTSTEEVAATATPKKANTASSGTGGLTYTQAVNLYMNRRVQFNDLCQPSPLSMVVKNGTSVMFDNRSSQARTFALDGVRYSLAGYGFRIVTLRYSALPHKTVIDCGTGKNNGSITVN